MHSDLGLSNLFTVRYLSVLDTGAAPNLIHIGNIPPAMPDCIRIVPNLDSTDANNKPLRTSGTIPFVVRLGSHVIKLEFIVCDSLAAPGILGFDFCDCVVVAVRQRARSVKLADGFTVLIVRKTLR